MDYNKSILIKPTAEQMAAVRFFFNSPKKAAGVRHGTGKGKSITSLCIAAYALKKRLVDRVLIFHIKSAAPAYRSDLEKHTRLPFKFVLDPEDYSFSEPIQLIQYNRAYRFVDLIKKDCRTTIAILDEVHTLKSPKSKTRTTFDKLRFKFDYVLGLTATPLANNVEDLYHITNYISPGYFGSLWEYKNKYCNMIQREIKKRITDKRTGKTRVATLKFYEITGYKNLDILMNEIDRVWHSAVSDLDIRFNVQKNPMHLLPAEEGEYQLAAQGLSGLEYKEFVSRLPELQRIVDASEAKLNKVAELTHNLTSRSKGVLIYFSIKHAIELLAPRLAAPYRILTGDSTIEERESIRAWFGEGRVVLMTAAGSRSLNFHEGNQVIFYNCPWEVEVIIQTVGRVARPMVSKYDHVSVYFPYISNTIDEYRVELFKSNSSLVQSVLSGGDPNLPKEFKAKKRSQIVSLRKSLLWRFD